MCAMTAAPGPAGGRVWEVMSRGRRHAWGARRRRALMLAILRNSDSPSADLKPPTVQVHVVPQRPGIRPRDRRRQFLIARHP
jgi:hypothetical protein